MGGIISGVVGLVTGSKQKKIAKRQARAAKAAADAQRESQRIAQVRANVEARRERIEQFREERIRKARILASAGNAGALTSTPTLGAVGGIGTQFSSNIGRINQAQGFGEAISQQNEIATAQQGEINRLEGRSRAVAAQGQIFKSIGQIGTGVFKRAGGFTSVFGGNSFGG